MPRSVGWDGRGDTCSRLPVRVSPITGKEACGHAKFVGFNSVAGVATAVKIDPTEEYNPKVKVNLQYTYLVNYQKMILATGNLPGITVTSTPASERNRQLDDLCEDTPGEEAEMTPFAERMHVYGELLGELKQRQKKKAQEAAAIRKAKR